MLVFKSQNIIRNGWSIQKLWICLTIENTEKVKPHRIRKQDCTYVVPIPDAVCMFYIPVHIGCMFTVPAVLKICRVVHWLLAILARYWTQNSEICSLPWLLVYSLIYSTLKRQCQSSKANMNILAVVLPGVCGSAKLLARLTLTWIRIRSSKSTEYIRSGYRSATLQCMQISLGPLFL
jgi:hypothetical protein